LNLRNQALAMTVLRAGVVPGAGSSDLDTRLAAANLRRGQLLYMACKACHGAAGAFGPVNRDCESCHAGWQQRFSHQQVGLELDELHGELECVSCHSDATFSARPGCRECHEDFTYPAKRPGKSVPPTRKP